MTFPPPPAAAFDAPSSSTTHVKQYRPYFTPAEVERLSAKQRGKLSVSREERVRQQACGFIDAVGVRCGFPRKTIATAQTLYMRFHLFFPYKDFNYTDVSLSTLYVSSKLHDTLKKPRDIILASYPLRFPQLVRKGTIDPVAAEAQGLEHERRQVLSIERLVLESMAFKFGVDESLGVVIKIGKKLGLAKEMCRDSWKLAVDCHRTPAPLSYPPHIITLGSIYAAALFHLESTQLEGHVVEDGEEKSAAWLANLLGKNGEWETDLAASASHVDEIVHSLIDLYHTILSNPTESQFHTPSPVSPSEPLASTSTTSSTTPTSTAFTLPAYWTVQTLTELKIQLRNRRAGEAPAAMGWTGLEEEVFDEAADVAADGMGRNDATVRFIWDDEVLRVGGETPTEA
ncbi:hypothetical protein IAT38_000822 [Cryptococcus sp. DSM 104549]